MAGGRGRHCCCRSRGEVSTARAGASVVAADDGEAIVLNPAGIAKAKGDDHVWHRRDRLLPVVSKGRAGQLPETCRAHESTTYANTPYPTMTNDIHTTPLGIGSVQPVPLTIAIVSDLRAARSPTSTSGSACTRRTRIRSATSPRSTASSGCSTRPPHPHAARGCSAADSLRHAAREEATIILPSIVAAYRILPQLDVGARFSLGVADAEVQRWRSGACRTTRSGSSKMARSRSTRAASCGRGARRQLSRQRQTSRSVRTTTCRSTSRHPRHRGRSRTARPWFSASIRSSQTLPPDSDARCAKGGTSAKLKACADIEIGR